MRRGDAGHLIGGQRDVVERARPALFGHAGPAVLRHRDHISGGREGVAHRAQVRAVVGGAPEPAVDEHDQRRRPARDRRGEPELYHLLGPRAVRQGQVGRRGGPVQDAGHRFIRSAAGWPG